MSKNEKLLNVLLIAFLIGSIIGGVLAQQKINRMNIKTKVIHDGVAVELNAEEFKEYKEGNYEISQSVVDLLVSNEEDSGDELIYLGRFKLTGYCDCEICQEEWVGITALGTEPKTNYTIAVDPDIIPLGSNIKIDGFDCTFKAEDIGALIQEKHIDIFCGSHEECYNDIYNRYADVYMEVSD